MISVTGRAGGCAEVPAHDERLVVDAAIVFDQLIGRDVISGHVFCVGMTARAGVGDVQGMHSGSWIAGRAHVMNAVTVRAHCHFAIP